VSRALTMSFVVYHIQTVAGKPFFRLYKFPPSLLVYIPRDKNYKSSLNASAVKQLSRHPPFQMSVPTHRDDFALRTDRARCDFPHRNIAIVTTQRPGGPRSTFAARHGSEKSPSVRNRKGESCLTLRWTSTFPLVHP